MKNLSAAIVLPACELFRRQEIFPVASAAHTPDILSFGAADGLLDMAGRVEFSLTDRVTGSITQGCAADAADDEIQPEIEALRANWQEFAPGGVDLPSASDKLLEVSKEVWRERLPRARFLVMFEDDTEPAWTSGLLKIEEAGVFICAACRLPLFTTPMKFHSGTGWPSFFTYIPGNLETQLDFSILWPRTEYHCVRCGSHQGHLFDNWPTPTGLRYCNNGLALQFLPTDGSEA